MTATTPREDHIFRQTRAPSDFRFDSEVATVFDDMVTRSVPFYGEMQRMICELARDFAVENTNLYDLGCSTGTTFLMLHPSVSPNVKFVGVDASEAMLQECRQKLERYEITRDCALIERDLNEGVVIENASVVTLILTLQFIRPLRRDRLMLDVFTGLNENGCLLLVEKVIGEDSIFNRLFIKYYYDMKRRNGYSDVEITQKREALENVLIPYKLLENRELLQRTGFRYVDIFFKWYNFCGIVAVK